MTPQEQAYLDGFLEMIQKVSFCQGFLEACAEDEVEPCSIVEASLKLIPPTPTQTEVEPLKVCPPTLTMGRVPSAEQEWIYKTQNLSPPRSLQNAA